MAGNGRGKVLGTSSKYDKGLSVLEQYGLSSENTWRGRGVLLCATDQGVKMIRPHSGSDRRVEKVNQILKHLQKCGHVNLDLVLENKEGRLISEDKEGCRYLVKNWYDARECDVRREADVIKCMEKLADLHRDMYGIDFVDDGYEEENLMETYKKHNQQLKKIRTYVRDRKQKQAFEYCYLESVERYLRYGARAMEQLVQMGYQDLRKQDIENQMICHGMCNQHNFLMAQDQVYLVNFDCFFQGDHMTDVAQFIRKIMEKHNWDFSLAHRMLEAYNKRKTITGQQWALLGVHMSYPEKFWKLANCYYNNRKSFFPEKNLEKLQILIQQEQRWQEFLKEIF